MIKDYGRGLIIGDSSTFGKGTVQSIVQIGDHTRRRDHKNRGALKLTIQQFYRANGESTQINGVAPHIHIPSLRDHMDFGEGKMDNALKFDKVAALPHDHYNRISPDLVDPAQRAIGPAAQGRPQVPEAGRADQEVPRPQGPALDRAERGQVQGRVRPRRRRQGRRRGEKAKKDKKKKKYTEHEAGRPTSTTTRSSGSSATT